MARRIGSLFRGSWKAFKLTPQKRRMHTASAEDDEYAGFFPATIIRKELFGTDMIKLRLSVGSKDFKYLAGDQYTPNC